MFFIISCLSCTTEPTRTLFAKTFLGEIVARTTFISAALLTSRLLEAVDISQDT